VIKKVQISSVPDGVYRRDFIRRSGLALAGITGASSLLTSVGRGIPAEPNPTCEDVVPAQNLQGDFEIIVDPDDVSQNLLLVANAPSPTGQDVVIARLDGATGFLLPDGLETIATTFVGFSTTNGPEFARQPAGSPSSLGILFAGSGGVRAAWRRPGAVDATTWRAFTLDVFGNTFPVDQPPLLPSSQEADTYPAGSPPFGLSSYPSFSGPCTRTCMAYLSWGFPTNLAQVAESRQFNMLGATPHPVQSGGFFFSGCRIGTINCGLYSAVINGNGGLVAGSVLKLAAIAPSGTQEDLIAKVHPSTGTTILFRGNGREIELWQQTSPGGRLNFVGSVSHPTSAFSHFRAETSTNQLVLYYRQTMGAAEGTYTVVVDANLHPSAPKHITTKSHGVELLYMPRAQRWATFTQSGVNFTRCWVVP
jgi:hypothetical protein